MHSHSEAQGLEAAAPGWVLVRGCCWYPERVGVCKGPSAPSPEVR